MSHVQLSGRESTPSGRRPLTLSVRLTLLMLLIVLPPLLLGQLIGNALVGRDFEDVANAQLGAAADGLASQAAAWLDLRARSLQQLVTQPDVMSMQPERQEPALRALTAIYTDTYLASTTDLTGRNVARSDGAAPSDYSDRAWFKQASAGAPVAIQTLIGRTSNQPALVMAAPIRDESHAIVGVGMFASELTVLRNELLSTRLGNTGRAYLINDQDQIVAHSNPALSDTELHSARQYPAVQALRQGGGPLLDFADSAGREWRSYAISMPGGWAIIVEEQISELLEPLNVFRVTTLVLVLAMLLIAGLIWLSLRRALRPIVQLTETATAITAGDFSRPLPATRPDEIGLLARAFGAMTARLRELIDSLETRVELRTAQLQASAEVGRAATALLNPDDLLQQIVALIKERFNFYYTAVFLLDETGTRAVLREASGPDNVAWVLKSAGHSLNVDNQSMVGSAILTRRARIALDVGAEAVRFANPLLPDTRSEIALPLMAGDRALGALDVQSIETGAFDEASAAVLQAMANQIAVALTNAFQYQREQARSQQTTGLLEAVLELSAQADREALNAHIVQVAMSLLDADGAGLWFPVDDQEIELQYTVNVGDSNLSGRRLRVGDGLTGQVFATGLTLRVDDYQTWRGHATAFADAPFHAALSVPLVWQDRIIGALALTRSQPGRPFSAVDESNAQLLATQAAAAIENVRLREEQQRALEQLDAVNRRLTGETWQDESLNVQAIYERQTRTTTSTEGGLSLEVPIRLRGQAIGLLTLQRQQPGELSDDERELIDGVVQQMSLALENQRLTSVAQRAARRDRAIAETADKIHQPTNLDTILRVAVDELTRITGAIGAGVQLGFVPLSSNGQVAPDPRRQEKES